MMRRRSHNNYKMEGGGVAGTGNFRLKALMWMIARRMQSAAKHSAAFKASLEGKNFVLQMTTASQRCSRYFQVKNGNVESHAGIHVEPTLTITFIRPDYGFELLLRASQPLFMRAMQDGEVKLHGDPAPLFWLVSVGRYLRPKLPDWVQIR
ncbi:MAG: hypothetical protein HKM02_11085 [Pseudomonadales bacterium]|nr:hypothetical protein [Pseudomonadales bacterium]